MPARHKLNAAYFQGSVVVAGIAGCACSSWTVFATALTLLLIGNVMAGDIRPNRPDRRN